MSSAVWVLLGTALLVTAIGVGVRLRAGRVRAGRGRLAPAVLAELGSERDPDQHGVTLLQLSTTFCAPCRQAAAVLAELADRTPGVRHVEVDLTDRPELAGSLRVRSTPTTLALDRDGGELLRLVGVPDAETLLAALRPHLRGPHLPAM
jgi:thiol-disulfide isomerase/thioredoxin